MKIYVKRLISGEKNIVKCPLKEQSFPKQIPCKPLNLHPHKTRIRCRSICRKITKYTLTWECSKSIWIWIYNFLYFMTEIIYTIYREALGSGTFNLTNKIDFVFT